jgi:hypothetical protein
MALTDRDYTHNWPAVQAEADARRDAREWDAYGEILRKAVDSTNNPAGKSPKELADIARHHYRVSHGACGCEVCLVRQTGVLS